MSLSCIGRKKGKESFPDLYFIIRIRMELSCIGKKKAKEKVFLT